MSLLRIKALSGLMASLLSTQTLIADPYTIFTGPGAGTVLNSDDGFFVFDLPTFTVGNLGSGLHCPEESLTIGNLTLGPTTVHYHGFLNGVEDPDHIECGWGHAVAGDYAGFFAPNFTSGTTKVFVLPHVLEKSGNILNTSNTFDTQIFMTYAGGLANPPSGAANIDLFLFDQNTGQLLKTNTGMDVSNANPFTIGSGSIDRKQTVTLDNLITNQGGFPSNTVLGFGILVVNGDVDNVAVQGFVSNSHSAAFDLSAFGFEPQPMTSPISNTHPSQILRLDNIHETPGSTDLLGGVADTLIKAIYTAGLVDGLTPSSVTIELSLFNDDGSPMLGLTGNPSPLVFTLDAGDRVFAMTVEEILQGVGGFTQPLNGYALAKVTGDLQNLVLSGFHIETGSLGPTDFLKFDTTYAAAVVPEPISILLFATMSPLLLRRRQPGTTP